MGEDPATGSAAGPLMAYLHVRRGLERLVIDQGIEMGRPSRLECAVEGDRVRVGGGAALVIEGTVLL
jgi:trans-2,3-dihydro-3-hydroxyanthranilate isomerase